MPVTEEQLRHMAALARLEISDARVPALVQELNGILSHMDVLQRVNLTAREDAVGVVGMRLRDDVPTSAPLATTLASFAPLFRDGFFLVPRLATHE